MVDSLTVHELLPKRTLDANKGTYGKALIVAGSTNYTGAAGLSSQAGVQDWVGLVTVAAPPPVVAVLSAQLLEMTWLLLPHDMGVISSGAVQLLQQELVNYDAMLLGPGWGREQTTREMLVNLLKISDKSTPGATKRPIGFSAARDVVSPDADTAAVALPPLLIDADGLNLLSELDDWWKLLPGGTIITPHPGEMGRLARMETRDILADRWKIAAAKASEWNVILVLKGAHTLIAAPDGRVAVLPFKTDALSTAGTGDVLAGIITGLWRRDYRLMMQLW